MHIFLMRMLVIIFSVYDFYKSVLILIVFAHLLFVNFEKTWLYLFIALILVIVIGIVGCFALFHAASDSYMWKLFQWCYRILIIFPFLLLLPFPAQVTFLFCYISWDWEAFYAFDFDLSVLDLKLTNKHQVIFHFIANRSRSEIKKWIIALFCSPVISRYNTKPLQHFRRVHNANKKIGTSQMQWRDILQKDDYTLCGVVAWIHFIPNAVLVIIFMFYANFPLFILQLGAIFCSGEILLFLLKMKLFQLWFYYYHMSEAFSIFQFYHDWSADTIIDEIQNSYNRLYHFVPNRVVLTDYFPLEIANIIIEFAWDDLTMDLSNSLSIDIWN